MLDLLSKLRGTGSGIGLVLSCGSTSDLFLQLHYCSTFLINKKRVLVITSHLAEPNLRTVFAKLALRWDPALISLLNLDSLLGDSLQVDHESLIQSLIKVLKSKTEPSLLIFDDVSILERLGVPAASVVFLLHNLYSRIGSDALLLALFSLETKAYRMLECKADFIVKLSPIGSGFGKEVTGKMQVTIRGVDPTPNVTNLLYLAGERSMKCFFPGGSSFLNF